MPAAKNEKNEKQSHETIHLFVHRSVSHSLSPPTARLLALTPPALMSEDTKTVGAYQALFDEARPERR